MMFKRLKACSIGYQAHLGFSRAESARVIGDTSKGIFLRSPGDQIAFLSYGSCNSPVTITLTGVPSRLETIHEGQQVRLADNRFYFDAAGVELDLTEALIWKPPPPPPATGGIQDWRERLRAIAQEAHLRKGDDGFCRLLEPLSGLPSPAPFSEEQQRLWGWIGGLWESLKRLDVPAAAVGIKRFLGLGRGLTPSGDDFAAGLLLIFNRWGSVCPPGLDIQCLNRLVIEAAWQRTTTLSANLISAATEGAADENLVATADAIFSNGADLRELGAKLAAIGHSSGVDTLVGMATAIAGL